MLVTARNTERETVVRQLPGSLILYRRARVASYLHQTTGGHPGLRQSFLYGCPSSYGSETLRSRDGSVLRRTPRPSPLFCPAGLLPGRRQTRKLRASSPELVRSPRHLRRTLHFAVLELPLPTDRITIASQVRPQRHLGHHHRRLRWHRQRIFDSARAERLQPNPRLQNPCQTPNTGPGDRDQICRLRDPNEASSHGLRG